MKIVSVTVEIGPQEIDILRRIDAYLAQSRTRSPQKHEIVSTKQRHKSLNDLADIRRFERLVLLGLVEHARNGYCWLTTQGSLALAKAERAEGGAA